MILTIYHLSFASLLPGLAAHLAPEMTKRGTAAWLAWCKPPRSSASLTPQPSQGFCDIYIYICIYIHTYIYRYTHTYIHTFIHTYIHIYICGVVSYIYTHRCTCLCLLMYIYIHVFMYLSSFIVLYLTFSYHIYR